MQTSLTILKLQEHIHTHIHNFKISVIYFFIDNFFKWWSKVADRVGILWNGW
jgi:hypothetical protein